MTISLETLNPYYRQAENEAVAFLMQQAAMSNEEINTTAEITRQLIESIRQDKTAKGRIETFLQEYALTTQEGVALMCLAEALLRVPDKETKDQLIRDKLADADWISHLHQSDSFTVNAATWGLVLTGNIISGASRLWESGSVKSALKQLLARTGEPLIRRACSHAMKMLSHQFIMGRDIEHALKRSKKNKKAGYTYSFDMLGESARTEKDAEAYFQSYLHAIQEVGRENQEIPLHDRSGISIKLSALHPRYGYIQAEHVKGTLTPKVFTLVMQAKALNIPITIDAEEANVLTLSLEIFEAIYRDPGLEGWEGLGLAVQAYQKRAFYVIDWLSELSTFYKRRIPVRLVKGAYWDSEIKMAQVQGLEDYPVFTRKQATDVSYLACAKKILSRSHLFYPQFATHNAYTVACILKWADPAVTIEFQCLHGMGQALYQQIISEKNAALRCRIYSPVGSYETLLPYLVRRMLENGANSSFVNQLHDTEISITQLATNPVAWLMEQGELRNPNIPLPRDIYLDRKNSAGLDLSDAALRAALFQGLENANEEIWTAAPIINGIKCGEQDYTAYSPSDSSVVIGTVTDADRHDVDRAYEIACAQFQTWDRETVPARAALLQNLADLLEAERDKLIYLLCSEAGKTLKDALSEIREAVDFCRYYANEAVNQLGVITVLPGYTGEYNQLEYRGRGVMVAISPWNFPLAIFLGQISSAIVSGNVVIAKPAPQTSLIATFVTKLAYKAGIPEGVLQLLTGGREIGEALVSHSDCAGVLFTGSTVTSQHINRTLAAKSGPIVPLIAETGGQNAMIVDSSALGEQVVMDVIDSAFMSAGQRCSACRVLFLQTDCADHIIELLSGAMAELVMGDPRRLDTDIGPLIDINAKVKCEAHLAVMLSEHRLIYQVKVPDECQSGYYFPPTAIEIPSLDCLSGEVFGPILHVIRYEKSALGEIIDSINRTGYGLTLGIHSRIDETIEFIQTRVNAGNCYVNRNMIGAVVGVQPFGGEGLSGTGPKAGGPNILKRLTIERTLSINTTAAGGNIQLYRA